MDCGTAVLAERAKTRTRTVQNNRMDWLLDCGTAVLAERAKTRTRTMQNERMDWLLDCRKNGIGSSYKKQIMYIQYTIVCGVGQELAAAPAPLPGKKSRTRIYVGWQEDYLSAASVARIAEKKRVPSTP